MRNANRRKPVCAVITGFGERTGDAAYVEIRKELVRLGWRVIPIDINWSRTTMTGWLKQADRALEDVNGADAIFGFSFGAMIAILLAEKRYFSSIIAASPSPYFSESIPTLPPIAEKVLGRRRMRDFRKFKMADAKDVIAGKVEIVVGRDDFPPLISAIRKLRRVLPNRPSLTVIPGARHDLGDPRYLRAVKKILSGLKIPR